MRSFLISLLLIHSRPLFAQKLYPVKIYTGHYIPQEDSTIAKILQDIFKIPKNNLQKTTVNIERFNGIYHNHLIKAGRELYLEIPANLIKSDTFYALVSNNKIETISKIKEVIQKEMNVKQTVKEDDSLENQNQILENTSFDLKKINSITYNFSLGNYTEKRKIDSYQLTNSQNSLASISYNHQRSITPSFSLSGSIYLSYLTDTESNFGTLKIPIEYGLSVSTARKLNEQLALFVGIDHERFSLFNIESDQALTLDNVKATYAVAGIHFYNLYNLKFNTRISYAYLFHANLINGNKNKGNKILIYNSIPLKDHFNLIIFLKNTSISNSTETNIFRYGIGLQYQF